MEESSLLQLKYKLSNKSTIDTKKKLHHRFDNLISSSSIDREELFKIDEYLATETIMFVFAFCLFYPEIISFVVHFSFSLSLFSAWRQILSNNCIDFSTSVECQLVNRYVINFQTTTTRTSSIKYSTFSKYKCVF